MRIVSLVPSATDTLVALGAQAAIIGTTYHDDFGLNQRPQGIVGGFSAPSLRKILSLSPTLVILSGLHTDLEIVLNAEGIATLNAEVHSLEGAFARTETLGSLVGKPAEAAAINDRIRDQLAHLARKIGTIPETRRRRVVRIMGRDQLMIPGKDSFQIQHVEHAGGIPLRLDKPGPVVPITLEEWTGFNPEIVYYCGKDSVLADTVLNEPGWRDVDAVENGRLYSLPCALTCRMSVHAGAFAAWLASMIYMDVFDDPAHEVERDTVLATEPVPLNLPYVSSAIVARTRLFDFENQTLVIDFNSPMTIVSTLEGPRTNITTVGNHYTPPPLWVTLHKYYQGQFRDRLLAVLERSEQTSAVLFTGAKIENLATASETYKDLTVHAVATAGVSSNAMRMSVDTGSFYDPGTINVILMANATLSDAAMSRTLIIATEAKTAALQDLDIRCSYTRHCQATGTGTDNIIMVSGQGPRIQQSGGHTKVGELTAKAVYAAVTQAIGKQNGTTSRRSVFARLEERGYAPAQLADQHFKSLGEHRYTLATALEALLLEDDHAGLIEMAMALSDAHGRGHLKDLEAFEALCDATMKSVSGTEAPQPVTLIADDETPEPLELALNALITGLLNREALAELRAEVEAFAG